jgi:hypothetical protein
MENITEQLNTKTNAQLIGIAQGTLSCLKDYAELNPLHKEWLVQVTQAVKQLEKNIL